MELDLLSAFLAARDGAMSAADGAEMGLDSRQLRALVRQGLLVRVCRGGYADARRVDGADPQDLHRVQVAAVLRAGGDSLAASHQSAAVVLGLPVLAKDLTRVHVVRRRPGGTGRRFDAFTRHECSETEFEQVGTLWSVGPVAAVLGTAAVASSLSGQAVVDAALRQEIVDLPALEAGLEARRRMPGMAAARLAVARADPSAESAGESGLRVVLMALGYRVQPQVRIVDRDGVVVGRVDFLLPELGVVVEFDGKVKYEGPEARKALVAEKQSEDRLRALGYGVVRITWAQLFAPDQIRQLVERSAAAVPSWRRARVA